MGWGQPVHDAFGGPASEDGRIFLPLAAGGCGVGCRYCYIPSPNGPARAMSPSRLRAMLKSLTKSKAWRAGPTGPIISIGYDTELAMTDAVLANALTCLDFAREHGLPVQLATKFPLPAPLRERLESWPGSGPATAVFTSITTVALSSRLEPGAPDPAKRAANFHRIGDGWLSYALIKPFLAFSAEDQKCLVDLLTRHARPDGVVVGIRYRRAAAPVTRPDDEDVRRHPIMPNWTGVPLPGQARDLVARLTTLGLRVFLSTRCVSAHHNRSGHGMSVKQRSPELCVGCGACP